MRAKRSNGVFEETSTVSSPTANEPQPRPDTDKYALLLSMRSTFTFIHLAGQSELQMWEMAVEHVKRHLCTVQCSYGFIEDLTHHCVLTHFQRFEVEEQCGSSV